MANIRLGSVFCCVVLAGCAQLPNPNELTEVAPEDRAHSANELLIAASELLDYKVGKGMLTDDQRLDLIKKRGQELVNYIDPKEVSAQQAWEYGDLLRLTDDWKAAETEYRRSLDFTDDAGQTVINTLRLAHAEAKNGNGQNSLTTASSVFEVPDDQTAPILPAVLYEIAPALKGKVPASALIDLLKGAVACHMRTKVDLKSDGGKLFILARRTHLKRAEKLINELGG